MSRTEQRKGVCRKTWSGDARVAKNGVSVAKNGVSVVICTHNGAERLRHCLDALSKCAFQGIGGEVIVIDNNSTDDSAHLSESYWEQFGTPIPLITIYEAKQGLAWARRTGAHAAAYDIIIYCDDDNLLAPDYVSVAKGLMKDPKVGAASGVAHPVSTGAFPSWFYTFADSYAVGYQVRDLETFGELDLDMTSHYHRCPWGAGLVVRRQDVLKAFRCPNFPLLIDRNGTTLSSGGDYEICHLIALQGKRLVFSPRLRLDHIIAETRLSPDYLRRLRSGFREGASANNAYATLRRLARKGRIDLVFGGLMQMIKNGVRGRPMDQELLAISLGLGHNIGLSEVQNKVLENYKFLKNNLYPTAT